MPREAPPRLVPGSAQAGGLFRSIIQHSAACRSWWRSPLDELGAIWNDHFISVREVRFGAGTRASIARP